jgi:rubrerythrin
MTVDNLIFAYVLCALAALSGVALYSEVRRRGFGPAPSEDHIFRCEKCGYVYTDDPDVDRSRCPQCGTMNGVYEF